MRRFTICAILVALGVLAPRIPSWAEPSQPVGVQQIDLAERLAAGKLRAVNREVSPLQGSRGAVHVTQKDGPGEVWIEGTDFVQGTIELDIRGRDLLQQSFVGVAFNRKDDNTFDAVYLRPFNFRSTDPARRPHSIQYIAMPDYDWPRLRKEFPEQFERSVDQSVAPTGWAAVRVVVTPQRVQAYVGAVKSPTLDVRKLGDTTRGLIGLWVGNNSDGDFANLRITATK